MLAKRSGVSGYVSGGGKMFVTTYRMMRGGDAVATVAVIGAGGRTVVFWPTSVIVYDTEEAARAVHVEHMGGRGEPTSFALLGSTSKVVERAVLDAYQDDCEGCGYASVSDSGNAWDEPATWKAPAYIEANLSAEYLYGYSIVANDWKRQGRASL